MGRLLDRIMQQYSSLEEDTVIDISPETVEQAISVLKNYRVHNTRGLFYFLSAINLLNAAIKRKEYKDQLKYWFIKGKAKTILEFVIARYKFYNVKYYYKPEEKCLYIEIYGVVFSFHNILEDEFCLENASKQEPIVWPGIRLQRIAQPLFQMASEIIG